MGAQAIGVDGARARRSRAELLAQRRDLGPQLGHLALEPVEPVVLRGGGRRAGAGGGAARGRLLRLGAQQVPVAILALAGRRS